MQSLSDIELNNISGGSMLTPFGLMYKIYRTLKIRVLMRKLFVD